MNSPINGHKYFLCLPHLFHASFTPTDHHEYTQIKTSQVLRGWEVEYLEKNLATRCYHEQH